jgi:hypothetical protein
MQKTEIDPVLRYIFEQIQQEKNSINIKNLAEAANRIADIYKY